MIKQLSITLGLVSAIALSSGSGGFTGAFNGLGMGEANAAPLMQDNKRPSNVAAALDRARGIGPFKRMVIRGATVMDGTGAPPIGPIDIVIENNIITELRVVGAPGVAIDPKRRPAKGDHEIDATGMFVLPGFINVHAHISTPQQFATGEAAPATYAYKLWLGHGVTTIRDVGAGNGRKWTVNEKNRSAKNEITAPRIHVYDRFSTSHDAASARKWVKGLKKDGVDGIKFGGGSPSALTAAFDEVKKQGLRTAMHHAQTSVTRWNVIDSARAGLSSMEHWYGLPEAMYTDRIIQDYPFDYNYMNEQDRFAQAGRLWKQAAEPGSKKWNEVMDELIDLDFTLAPTMTIYEAARDVQSARTQPWLKDYTWPDLTKFFAPSKTSHGSFFFDWTTGDEIEWKRNYQKWMKFINEYKNKGGRVTVGDDAGFIYKLYGFGYIREFELLQEAGFHPLEVLRSATLSGAELMGIDDKLGSVEKGKLADLVIIDQNPLQNFKVLYGTGTPRLNLDTNKMEQVGGVNFTIKDGIVYDAKKLMQDVKEMAATGKVK
jgi:imidazolonepropionase-like amidohydrolase